MPKKNFCKKNPTSNLYSKFWTISAFLVSRELFYVKQHCICHSTCCSWKNLEQTMGKKLSMNGQGYFFFRSIANIDFSYKIALLFGFLCKQSDCLSYERTKKSRSCLIFLFNYYIMNVFFTKTFYYNWKVNQYWDERNWL